MDWLQITILGIVQGITEFLPVSSSGHLVVLQALFAQLGRQKLPEDIVAVNILLHAGTLAAILLIYWRRIFKLLTEDRRAIGLLIVGTLPAVIVGLPVKLFFKGLLESPLLTGYLFIATGLLLIWTGRRHEGDLDYQRITYGQALLIGCFQAAAILPGLSRSGWTIGGGLLVGLRREAATTFAFLLAIPTIGGAAVLELKDFFDPGTTTGTPAPMLAWGTLIAFLVGLASLWGLIQIVQRGRLQWFALWCIPLGIAVILWQTLST